MISTWDRMSEGDRIRAYGPEPVTYRDVIDAEAERLGPIEEEPTTGPAPFECPVCGEEGLPCCLDWEG